jgi:hypothetical protein
LIPGAASSAEFGTAGGYSSCLVFLSSVTGSGSGSGSGSWSGIKPEAMARQDVTHMTMSQDKMPISIKNSARLREYRLKKDPFTRKSAALNPIHTGAVQGSVLRQKFKGLACLSGAQQNQGSLAMLYLFFWFFSS